MAPLSSRADNAPDVERPMRLEILMGNGLWIKKQFHIPCASLERCSVLDPYDYSHAEIMYRCEHRLSLLHKLRRLVPTLIQSLHTSWFRTMNKEDNLSHSCLFEGAKLELNVSSITTSEFGFCFPRRSFVTERDRLDINAMLQHSDTGDWKDWTRRGPSDADRLRVNKNGREIFYFVQPPRSQCDVSLSELRAELCHTLQIAAHRVALAAGPFYWGPDFEEDGLGLYSTYFDADLEIDLGSMKTLRGAALLDVVEDPIQSSQT